jgi:hypothetical protein
MTKPLDQLMEREMSRKEFIATLSFGVASIMGFSGIIHLLTGKSFSHRGISQTSGYGGSAYGGGKD